MHVQGAGMHHAGVQQLQTNKNTLSPMLLTACMSGTAADSGLGAGSVHTHVYRSADLSTAVGC